MPRFPLARPFHALLVAVALVRAASASASSAGASSAGEEAEAPPASGEEIVVVGRRRAQAEAARAPGAAVTVIDAGRFAGEAKGAGELLASSPGVAVADHGGLGRHSTVSIRGSSAEQVKVLIDGIPVNPSAGGGVDLSSIPSQWISRIEVVRGTEGVHHGSGALGGVVNVVTAAPRAGTWFAGVTAGSFDTWQADAQAGGGGDGWAILGSAAASTTSGRFDYLVEDRDPLTPTYAPRRHNASRLAGALLKGFVLTGRGRLDATAQLSGGARDLPGTMDDATPDDWQEDARALVSARFRRPAPGGLFLSSGLSARLDRLDSRLEDLGGVVARQRGVAATATFGADWTGAHGTLAAELEAGVERLRAAGMGDHARPTTAATLSGEALLLGERARLGPGVRLERAGDHAGVSAKLGGAVALGGPLSLRGSAGRTYRVPSFAELYLEQGVVAPNPDLRPEVGLGGDAALAFDGSLGAGAIGGFAMLYRDLVVYEAVSFRRFSPRNSDRSVVRGVEVELATVPLRRAAGLASGLAYTFTDSATLRGKESELGKEVPRKPRHRLYLRVGVGGAAADAHAEVQWISRQWLDTANRVEAPEALTFGAGASVRLWRRAGLRLHVEARNLLDDRSLTDGYRNPLPGRTVLVTLRAADSKTEIPR